MRDMVVVKKIIVGVSWSCGFVKKVEFVIVEFNKDDEFYVYCEMFLIC